ncbi:hypothetical protein M422DRAFT_246619 [Sphaerobolus stellatus SS14]|nr:hypothetical protein M422DRAFT_246619 [Sphaerobolus stellatus SS14]
MSAAISPITNGRRNENAERISALIADFSPDDNPSQSQSDLPIGSSLSHANSYLSAPEFSVEEFLLSRAHTSLPDLRTELRDYQSQLKEELVQLINDDYAAFISLSTDLRGEGTRLEKLKQPLGGLKKEIKSSLDELKLIEATVQERLDERAALREEKALLHLLLKLSESLARIESLLLITPPDSTAPSSSALALDTGLSNVDEQERSRTSRVKHLSRVASEFNQLLYLVEKARTEKCAFVDEIQWRVDRVKSTLFSDLDHTFATTLGSVASHGNAMKTATEQEKARWKSDLKECLRTYDSLGGWRQTEEVIRREVMSGFIKETIFSGALTVPHSPLMPTTPFVTRPQPTSLFTPTTPFLPVTARPRKTPFEPQFITIPGSHLSLLDDADDPLAGLYNQILRFVDRDLKSLMETAESFSSRRRQLARPDGASLNNDMEPDRTQNQEFEIMSNVVWPEIARALLEELGSTVFSAGRPDEFRQNYATTQSFLAALELMSPSMESIQSMRSHPTYIAFQRRWQLPVYFQLRWKDIVGKLEDELKPITETQLSKDTQSSFATPQALAVYEAVHSCWKAEICIPEIGHRFWRLTLQILSRYKGWLEANIPPKEPSANVVAAMAAERAHDGRGTPVSRSATPIPPQDSSEDNAVADNVLLKRCGVLVSDINELERKMLGLWDAEISIILPEVSDLDDDQTPYAALKASLRRLADIIPSLASHIIAILTKRCCEALTLVRAIPQQYRAMANKKLPSEPSHFVRDILRPMSSFFATLPQNVRDDLGPTWANEIFGAVCLRYVSYLVAMRKTEESLRRLKKGKTSAFSLFGGGASAASKDQDAKDEERVRTQMILDVAALGKDARQLGVDIDSHSAYQDLKALASQTQTEGAAYFGA